MFIFTQLPSTQELEAPLKLFAHLTMSIPGLTNQSLTTRNSQTYVYHTSPPKSHARPTILLLHGQPDTSHLWTRLITASLLPQGYGVIAPDLLGFGASSKPIDSLSHYTCVSLCADLVEILSAYHETARTSTGKVIVLGHDFGTYLACRLWTFHPHLLSGIVLLGNFYAPPAGKPFDLPSLAAMSHQMLGYSAFEYWSVFLDANGHKVISGTQERAERLFASLHGGGERMKEVFCVPGALEAWCGTKGNENAAVLPYAQDAGFRREWVERLAGDGMWAPLMWYQALASQDLDVIQPVLDAENQALQEGRATCTLPMLFVRSEFDPLGTSPALVEGMKGMGLVTDVRVESVQSGHWSMLEKSDDLGRVVVGWTEQQSK